MRKSPRPNPRRTSWVPLTTLDRQALEQHLERVEALTSFVRRSLLEDAISRPPPPPRRPRPTR